MLEAYVDGVPNHIAQTIRTGSARSWALVRSFAQGDPLSVPPVAVLEPSGLKLVDGNHRVAALLYCMYRGYPVNPRIPCWIGSLARDA